MKVKYIQTIITFDNNQELKIGDKVKVIKHSKEEFIGELFGISPVFDGNVSLEFNLEVNDPDAETDYIVLALNEIESMSLIN